MSSTIDWNKAPAGTIGHGIVGECLPVWIGADWYEHAREDGGRYFFAGMDARVIAWRRADVTNYVARPTESPTWNGEGLPPVGTICEVQAKHIQDGYWTEVEILAHAKHDEDDAVLVCQIENGRRADMDGVIYAPERFRPIRTPEQIAAEAREKDIEDMAMIGRMDDSPRSMARKLYDAGYRKVEQP